jgi:hypothetical protein
LSAFLTVGLEDDAALLGLFVAAQVVTGVSRFEVAVAFFRSFCSTYLEGKPEMPLGAVV